MIQQSFLDPEPTPLPPRLDQISACGTYRYWLRVPLAAPGTQKAWTAPLLWIMLNPSTATKDTDDPTMESVLRVSRNYRPHDLPFEAVEVCNLFAFRSPDPKALLAASDPVGPDNDDVLLRSIVRAKRVIVAWGSSINFTGSQKLGAIRGRDKAVLHMIHSRLPVGSPLLCVGRTASGQPRHPLYLSGATQPELYQPPT